VGESNTAPPAAPDDDDEEEEEEDPAAGNANEPNAAGDPAPCVEDAGEGSGDCEADPPAAAVGKTAVVAPTLRPTPCTGRTSQVSAHRCESKDTTDTLEPLDAPCCPCGAASKAASKAAQRSTRASATDAEARWLPMPFPGLLSTAMAALLLQEEVF
jgi:hypothetical protein